MYCLKDGKCTVSCHPLKRSAVKKQKALLRAGRATRLVKRADTGRPYHRHPKCK